MEQLPETEEEEQDADQGWWSEALTGRLLGLVRERCVKKLGQRYNSAFDTIPWEEVAQELQVFSADDCKKRFSEIQQGIRKYRTAKEVLDEIDVMVTKFTGGKLQKNEMKLFYPDRPKQPMSASFIYVHKMLPSCRASNPGLSVIQATKQLNEDYKNLSEKKKKKYLKKAAKAKEQYDQHLLAYKQKHPEYMAKPSTSQENKLQPPLRLYLHEKLESHQDDQSKGSLKELREKYTTKWKSMSDKKKNKYIKQAIQQYMELRRNGEVDLESLPKNFLSKDDLKVQERIYGVEDKTTTAYSLFVHEQLSETQSEEFDFKKRMPEISVQWRQLSDNEKDQYDVQAKERKARFTENLAKALSGMDEDEKLVFLQLHKLKRSQPVSKVKAAQDLKTFPGEPKFPPSASRDLYIQDCVSDLKKEEEKMSSERTTEAQKLKEADRRWKMESSLTRQEYEKKLEDLRTQYKARLSHFVQSLEPALQLEFCKVIQQRQESNPQEANLYKHAAIALQMKEEVVSDEGEGTVENGEQAELETDEQTSPPTKRKRTQPKRSLVKQEVSNEDELARETDEQTSPPTKRRKTQPKRSLIKQEVSNEDELARETDEQTGSPTKRKKDHLSPDKHKVTDEEHLARDSDEQASPSKRKKKKRKLEKAE